jgi:hypothetical protein
MLKLLSVFHEQVRIEGKTPDLPLDRAFLAVMNRIASGAKGFEPPTLTQAYYIYPAYSFHFFTKGFFNIIWR